MTIKQEGQNVCHEQSVSVCNNYRDTRFEFIAIDLNEDGNFETLLLDADSKEGPEYAFSEKAPMPILVSVRFLGTGK